jgi:hypothetical protein
MKNGYLFTKEHDLILVEEAQKATIKLIEERIDTQELKKFATLVFPNWLNFIQKVICPEEKQFFENLSYYNKVEHVNTSYSKIFSFKFFVSQIIIKMK